MLSKSSDLYQNYIILGEVACNVDCPSIEEVFNGYTDKPSGKSEQCPKCEGDNLDESIECLENPSKIDTISVGTCVAEYFRTVTDGEIDLVTIKRYKEKKEFEPSFQRTSLKACSSGDFCNADVYPETTTRYQYDFNLLEVLDQLNFILVFINRKQREVRQRLELLQQAKFLLIHTYESNK